MGYSINYNLLYEEFLKMKIQLSRNFFYNCIMSIVEWIIVIFLILFTGGIWLLKENSFILYNNSWVRIAVYMAIGIWTIPFMMKKRQVNRKYIIWIAVSLVCVAIPLLESVNTINFAILRFYCPIGLGLLIGLYVPRENFWKLLNKFITIMFLIACISLFFWIFGAILQVIPSSGDIYFEWNDIRKAKSYFGLYYVPLWQIIVIGNSQIVRNCGIFTEAPMYGFLLCVAYSFYRMREKQKRWVGIIIVVTILSTIGTTAIVYLLLFEVISFGLKKSGNNIMGLLKFFLFFIIVIISTIVIYNLVISKFSTGSGSVRQDHFRVALELFKATFPFGCGIGNFLSFERLEIYKQGLSIGLPAVYAMTGVGGMVITLFPLGYLSVTSILKKEWKLFAFVIAFLWINICTSVQFNSPFSWLIILYAAKGTEGFVADSQ